MGASSDQPEWTLVVVLGPSPCGARPPPAPVSLWEWGGADEAVERLWSPEQQLIANQCQRLFWCVQAGSWPALMAFCFWLVVLLLPPFILVFMVVMLTYYPANKTAVMAMCSGINAPSSVLQTC